VCQVLGTESGGHKEEQEDDSKEKSIGEEMLEAYRAHKVNPKPAHPSASLEPYLVAPPTSQGQSATRPSSSEPGQLRSKIPVAGPPPTYQTALLSSHMRPATDCTQAKVKDDSNVS
jgi:hypothetical protein